MPNSKLNELISELEGELAKLDPENTNEVITQVEKDLKALESLDLEEAHENHVFLEAAVKFEDSHPKLASTLNDIAHLLSNIGI
jgi:hypothetical protein